MALGEGDSLATVLAKGRRRPPQTSLARSLISSAWRPTRRAANLGDAGYQIRTAEEEEELLRRAQSLTESDSEVDREVESTASRVFSPFEEEGEDIPAL